MGGFFSDVGRFHTKYAPIFAGNDRNILGRALGISGKDDEAAPEAPVDPNIARQNMLTGLQQKQTLYNLQLQQQAAAAKRGEIVRPAGYVNSAIQRPTFQ